ncbi:MAG: hypothetical protein U0798_20220 [Gemmataceae bacterium]
MFTFLWKIGMSRFRTIDCRFYGDERVRRLSQIQPSGRFLFLYLLTGPSTTNIPGLFRAGEYQLAEELGWSVEDFRKAFREVFREGLAEADWGARLVWVPNAIKYNSPVSPNVVKSWGGTWDELPECLLKAKAWQRLKDFTEGKGQGFREAFRKALGESGTGPGPGTGLTICETPSEDDPNSQSLQDPSNAAGSDDSATADFAPLQGTFPDPKRNPAKSQNSAFNRQGDLATCNGASNPNSSSIWRNYPPDADASPWNSDTIPIPWPSSEPNHTLAHNWLATRVGNGKHITNGQARSAFEKLIASRLSPTEIGEVLIKAREAKSATVTKFLPSTPHSLLCETIADVTGMSATLNGEDIGRLAKDLLNESPSFFAADVRSLERRIGEFVPFIFKDGKRKLFLGEVRKYISRVRELEKPKEEEKSIYPPLRHDPEPRWQDVIEFDPEQAILLRRIQEPGWEPPK